MDYSFRTLNYLGSKLRLLDFIEDNVKKITPVGARVCDLFAGSGCVSYRLSKSYPISACDIQTYSKVICHALLGNFEISNNIINDFYDSFETESGISLLRAFSPLIQVEKNAINEKNLDVLTSILEHGSVEVFNLEGVHSLLNEELHIVSQNIKEYGLKEEDSLISRYYGGIYFSYLQAVQIDIILQSIHTIIQPKDRDVFLAALISTASDIADTVGKHFAQPIKARDSKGNIKVTVYNKAVKDKTINVFDLYKDWLARYLKLPKAQFNHNVIQDDYMNCLHALSPDVKTVYADPPYTRDHYSRFYHVLETIALRDCPELSTTNIHGETHVSNGIYRKERHQSPFCIKSKAPEAFINMFEYLASTHRNLLLSYSPYDETKKTHPRVVTMEQLLTWGKEYFENVEVISAGSFKHNKLNSVQHFLEASEEAELLFVFSKK